MDHLQHRKEKNACDVQCNRSHESVREVINIEHEVFVRDFQNLKVQDVKAKLSQKNLLQTDGKSCETNNFCAKLPPKTER